MFGIGGVELLIIVVFVLLIFGPDKLPQFGRTIGQMVREFKRAQETMEAVIRAEVYADKRASATGGSPEGDEDDEDFDDTPPVRDPSKPLIPVETVPDDEDEEEEE